MVSKTTLSRDCEFPAVLHVSNGECPWNVGTFNMMDNELEPRLGQVQGFFSQSAGCSLRGCALVFQEQRDKKEEESFLTLTRDTLQSFLLYIALYLIRILALLRSIEWTSGIMPQTHLLKDSMVPTSPYHLGQVRCFQQWSHLSFLPVSFYLF